MADENIHPDVVAALRAQGKDVRTVHDEQMLGSDDLTVLRRAHASGRVVVTHDSDFGRLAIADGVPYTGILFVRPGHISAAFVLATIAVVEAGASEVTPPFILVAECRGDDVRVRVRSGS